MNRLETGDSITITMGIHGGMGGGGHKLLFILTGKGVGGRVVQEQCVVMTKVLVAVA